MPPPYISYRVDVRSSAPSLPPFERRMVTIRTADGKALVREGERSAAFGEAIPLAPNLDALAEWAFAFDTSGGHVRLNVAYERPKRYAAPTPAPGDTVVVASVGAYSVTYAGDDTTHIVLEPASHDERAFAVQPNHFVYRDVWFDPLTCLPTRVALVALGETFQLDYTIAQGHWLLQRFTYDGTLTERAQPRQLEHIEADYSGYTFPEQVPELQ